jgi:hypothetical protein
MPIDNVKLVIYCHFYCNESLSVSSNHTAIDKAKQQVRAARNKCVNEHRPKGNILDNG